MKENKGKLYIGTSGYAYPHWEKGVFYPFGLPKSSQLEYYARHFNSVEMNYPFYRLPSVKSFSHWRESVPKEFIFSVKVSRYITHVKRLHNIKDPWNVFLERALSLKEKLGPFLLQFSPNWKKNLDRLNNFIEIVKATDKKYGTYRFVLEFRHPSWFSDDVYDIIKNKKNISLCLADSPSWPLKLEITGDFVYIRMHGEKLLYSSDYSKAELKKWAIKIKKWLKEKLDVYIYFNNDSFGYAPKNAKELFEFIQNQ